MKKIVISFVILFSINTVSAQSVCEPECAFDFVFNNGGTLVATSDITFTYAQGSEINLGETGTINTAIQLTDLDFSAGGVLRLSEGDSITFDSGGYFNMAQGSNLSSFSYTLTGGDSSIVGGAGPTTITIHGALSTDGSWAIQASQVNFNNDITVNNDISISNGNALNGTSISGVGNINTDTISAFEINGSVIDNTGSIVSVADINLTITNPVITVTGPITALENLSGLQGMELSTVGGAICTVKDSECIADNGDIYVLKDSKLVLQQDDAAGSLWALLLAFLWLAPHRFSTGDFGRQGWSSSGVGVNVSKLSLKHMILKHIIPIKHAASPLEKGGLRGI